MPTSHTLTVTGALTAKETTAWLVQPWQQGQHTTVDLSGVTQVDSSAVALLLAWHRAARAIGASLSIQNPPISLQRLARLYHVDEWLWSGLATEAKAAS